MSSKKSTRVKTRQFLKDTGEAFQDIFRSRSPASSSSSAVQPDKGAPTPNTADSTPTIIQGLPIDKPLGDINVTASTTILEQHSTRSPTLELTPTHELLATESLETPGGLSLQNSIINASRSFFTLPSAPPTTEESPLPGVGQDTSSSQGAVVTGMPSNPDVVVHAPEPSSSGYQAKDTTSAILRSSLNALGKCAGVVPTFKSVVDILTDCVDNIPAAAKNHKSYQVFVGNITTTINSLEVHLSQVNSTQMSESIRNVIGALTEVVNRIKETQARTTLGTYVEVERDIDDLINHYRQVDAILRQLQDARLEKLSPVKMAFYDSNIAPQLGRGGCTPNTRQTILEGLQDWASNPCSSKVYWMNGMAGTGKTTIAYSFCSRLEASYQLAASFFCSRSFPDCQDVTRIAPTIMYCLALRFRPVKDVLSRVLGHDPTIGARGITTQVEKLISSPLQEAKNLLPDGLPVVVIDALDECSSPDNTRLFLSSLLRVAEGLPIKFFLTCRPDSTLLDQLSSGDNFLHSLLHLHNIEQSLVQADIKTYLRTELQPLLVSENHLFQLSMQSGKLFIHAATAVRYVQLGKSTINHRRRLEVILGISSSSSDKPHEPLDALYTTILSNALEDQDLETWDRENIELLLHTVVCAREPLSIESLTCFLKFQDTDEALRAIEPLRSVLYVDDLSGLVSTLHTSFSDYMLASNRSSRFPWDQAKHHVLLSQRCFETMSNMLCFNICSLGSSYVLDRDIPDLTSRIKESIPPHLFYACQYWSDHLALTTDSSVVLALVSEFLARQVLFWTEVMNLKQATRAGVTILANTYQWMKNSGMSAELHGICQDAQKFITVIGASPVSRCTPHIYLSVLAAWDRSEPMWMYYGKRMQKLVRATGTAIDNRESAGLTVWQYKASVFSVSVFPNGRWVASGSFDHTVCIWDVHNGKTVVGPLQGHTGSVNCVAFSPDGAHVASGSDDQTVHIWDSKTGRLVLGPFVGHTGIIYSVAFSPREPHVASSSGDTTVRIWDLDTGGRVVRVFHGHESAATSVAYSPNGENIASGSRDGSICIWDTRTGHLKLGPLNRYTNPIWSVKYSPDGSRIISGSSDCTIRFWSSHSGDLIGGPYQGHTEKVLSVAYSPDGAHIVSSSEDHTIRIRDVQTGETVAGPLRGHTEEVYTAVYMPDGNRIVSCSVDNTIRIWDARSRPTRSSPSEGHTAAVQSVAFSPDGSRIVSGSDDHTVCIWDAQTGRRLVGPFIGHTSYVNSVAFSPSGDRVASASSDHTIRVWDAHTGATLDGPFEGHTDDVASIAFSPDGRHLASGSVDRTVRVWDTQSWNMSAGPFQGHVGWVFSVAYSPDGGHIVSGSGYSTLRIWDIQTGANLAGLFKGHTQQVNSVSYSPDGRRVLSGSDDHTICIWDAETGHCILGPLTGHSQGVWSVTCSPDGRHFVSGSEDHTIRIWHAETAKPLTDPIGAHTHWVKSVAFSPDSQLLASCSLDSTIRVWDKQKCLATPENSDCWAVDEDGWVVGHDSSLLFWVPSDLRPMLKWPQNVTLIHQFGSFELDFTNAALGSRWTKCWKSE
ncbi:hypothetical protein FRC09_004897 [Ceratobasidium sp. 395]|nr:hypothetical protein FRC09_004897 [Ceratobasidium sp. 395]